MKRKIKKLEYYSDMMSVMELCEFLSISRTTAYLFLKDSGIKNIRIGREYKINKRSLAKYLEIDLMEDENNDGRAFN